MTRGTDAETVIERALIRHAADAGVALEISAARSRPWASVTFSGARHMLAVSAATGGSAEQWLSALADAELSVAGHLVADAVVGDRREVDGRIEAAIELLSVEDR